jgi:hypothetical protein
MIGQQKVSGAQLAGILSLSPQRIRQLTVEGVLSTEKGKRGYLYEVREAVQEYVDFRLEGMLSTPELSELQRQRSAKLAVETERAKFNLEVLKGKYLLATAVGYEVTQQSLIIKSRVFGLGPRLCQQLAGQSDPDAIRETLDQEATDICALLVSDFGARADEADKVIAEYQSKNGHESDL